MAQYLPLLLQSLMNTPLAVSAAHGQMIAAALSGRLDIRSVETETTRLDQRALRDLAQMGRAAADEDRARFSAAIMMPEQSPYDGLWNRKTFPQIGRIAVVPIQGTLTRTWGLGPYSGSTGYDGIQTMVLDAFQDESVKAIWLAIGSGGGAVDGCFDLQELIWTLNARNGGKPIVAMASDYAYSAAYALGVAADEFYVPRTGGVGSVGVIMLHADISKALEQEGIAVKVIRSGKRKAIGIAGVEPLDDAKEAHLQAQCDEIRDIFVERVAEYRGISKSVVLQTEGLDYMGQRAKAIGFVTDVLSEQQAWAKLERAIA
jgi:capsid assembly protease